MLGATVVLDACVLYPAPLRDLLMHLALVDLFRARWTERIHYEWIRNVLADRPDLTREQLDRTRKLMNSHVRDCVVDGYETLIDQLVLPDEDDRHVLAAAIKCEANFILTFNLKDFPPKTLAKFGIKPIHPDDLIMEMIEADDENVRIAATRHWKSLKKPPKSLDEYLSALRLQGLQRTTDRLADLLGKRIEC